MEYKININKVQENGRCKADLYIIDLNLFIGGFTVVPGPKGRGVIVHMPKGMGTNWKYKEIEWSYVRNIISEEYLKYPGIDEILKSLFVDDVEAKKETKSFVDVGSKRKLTELYVHLYNFESKTGDCLAGIILPKSKIRIEGFKVKNDVSGGISVYMPKYLRTFWKYEEITWKSVRQKITEQYQKEKQYIETSKEGLQEKNGFIVEFHSCIIEYKYELTIKRLHGGEDIQGSFFIGEERVRLDILSKDREILHNMGVEIKELAQMCKDAFDSDLPVSDQKDIIAITVGDCIGQTVSAMVDFSLPNSSYVWNDFFIKQMEDGTIIVGTPASLKKKWVNPKYSWNVLCNMLKGKFLTYITTLEMRDDEKEDGHVLDEREDALEAVADEMDADTFIVEKAEPSEKKKQFMALRNQMQRVRNAENTAFAFMPHSILKLVDVSVERKNLTRQIVYAINSPQGGIGLFEIEILDWVSRFKYVAKTMILDLVLSGCISLGGRERITAAKMTDVMNRLYKYDLIESSTFVSVDDFGNSLTEGGGAKYRVHTLGATGYNLLREMGRHPERRNPFGVLADGNTVKKQLSANQWLVYWLTHYKKSDVLDFSINTFVFLNGLKWNGARIYASVNLETETFIAEPVRKCEDFEKESYIIGIQEKLMRLIDMLNNKNQLYTSLREQIIYPTRPIISFICEDDEHMREVAEYVSDIITEYGQQGVWFTTDIRMFNYDCKGQRFFELIDGNLEVINLKEKTGLEEMAMEERGGLFIG